MSLSAIQYDIITREYDKQRLENKRLLDERKRKLYEQIPELRIIEEALSDIAIQYASSLDGGQGISMDEISHKITELREEKEALLSCSHIASDYLTMHYACPDCKDTGYINGEKCHCFIQKTINLLYKQSNLTEILNEENFSTFSFKYHDVDSIGNIKVALNACKNFVKTFPNTHENILLCGTVGTGKTFLSNCIAKALLDSGYSVLYLSAFELFDVIKKHTYGYQKDSSDEIMMQYPHIFQSDLLIIDDLGTEHVTNSIVSALFLVINERILSGKSTLISTNLSPEQILKNYTERTYSRIVANFTMMKLTGKDIRLKKKLGGSKEC